MVAGSGSGGAPLASCAGGASGGGAPPASGVGDSAAGASAVNAYGTPVPGGDLGHVTPMPGGTAESEALGMPAEVLGRPAQQTSVV